MHHPTRLYCFSIDVAKHMHFRDSQHFFNFNPSLPRISTNQKERDELVKMGLLQPKLKQRPVNIVSTRACFRRFGHRIVWNGQKLIDDYRPPVEGEEEEEEERERLIKMREEEERKRPLEKKNEALIVFPPHQVLFRMAERTRQWNRQTGDMREGVGGFWDGNTGVWQTKQPPQAKQQKELLCVQNTLVDDLGEEFRGDLLEFPIACLTEQFQALAPAAAWWLSVPGDSAGLRPGAVLDSPPGGYPRFTTSAPEPVKIIHRFKDRLYCGVIATSSGLPCRRPVNKTGEKCLYHANESGCPFCQQPESPLTATLAVAKADQMECSNCHRRVHLLCTGIDTALARARVAEYPWCCNDCKVCAECGGAGDEANLLICDGCERAWHGRCCRPPISELPEGKWLCFLCTKCHSCQLKKKKGKPVDEYFHPVGICNEREEHICTLCRDCNRDFENNRLCPCCLETFKEDSDEESDEDDESWWWAPNKMIACDVCERWVHPGCDDVLTKGTYDKLVADAGSYTCPMCRNESGGTRRVQVRCVVVRGSMSMVAVKSIN